MEASIMSLLNMEHVCIIVLQLGYGFSRICIPFIWVTFTPMIGYYSSHYGDYISASCIVGIYEWFSWVSFLGHHVMLYVQGNLNLSWPFVVLLTIHVSFVLGDSISSHHLLVYLFCRLMGDTLSPSFDGSLSNKGDAWASPSNPTTDAWIQMNDISTMT